MAQLLQVPPAVLEKFQDAGDLFTWMENRIEPSDPQRCCLLSPQRLDKLCELLSDPFVGAASVLPLIEGYKKRFVLL